MEAKSFENRLEVISTKIVPLARIITALAESLPPPLFYDSGREHYGFRFGKPGVVHFCLLKGVRVVSALHAAIALARFGYIQEVFVLVRTLIEYTTHIEFVLQGFKGNNTVAPDAEKYVSDFFADFARNGSSDFKRAQVKQTTVNKRLSVALDRLAEQQNYLEPRINSEEIYSEIFLTYSSYVHAKYPEVMDLYGGDPTHFHLEGMLGTPKDDELTQIIDTFVDTASTTFRLMVIQLELRDLVLSDPIITDWFRS